MNGFGGVSSVDVVDLEVEGLFIAFAFVFPLRVITPSFSNRKTEDKFVNSGWTCHISFVAVLVRLLGRTLIRLRTYTPNPFHIFFGSLDLTHFPTSIAKR